MSFFGSSRRSAVVVISFLALLTTLICIRRADTVKASAIVVTSDLNPDAKTDPDALDKYQSAIAALLQQEKFAQLDEIANAARSHKERFSGGGWKLYTFYQGLTDQSTATPKQMSEAAWQAHLERLKKWVTSNPSSVTARIALAEAYHAYAWKARGSGWANEVRDQQWKAFEERLAQEQQILNDAAKLSEKCPHWYAAQLGLAIGQGWSKEKTRELMEQAISFEPAYYYNLRGYETYLLPRWYGDEGEAERFADEVSSRIGGKLGAATYFELAVHLNCGSCGNRGHIETMSWMKIRQGYAASEELYGVSMMKLNQFAYMAVHAGDGSLAKQLFGRIGDRVFEEAWGSREYFNQCKEWADQFPEEVQIAPKANVGPEPKEFESIRASVTANMATQQGAEYREVFRREFSEKNLPFFQSCLMAVGDEIGGSFDLFIGVGEDGTITDLKPWPRSKFTDCVVPKINRGTYTKPPTATHWLLLPVPMPSRPVKQPGQN